MPPTSSSSNDSSSIKDGPNDVVFGRRGRKSPAGLFVKLKNGHLEAYVKAGEEERRSIIRTIMAGITAAKGHFYNFQDGGHLEVVTDEKMIMTKIKDIFKREMAFNTARQKAALQKGVPASSEKKLKTPKKTPAKKVHKKTTTTPTTTTRTPATATKKTGTRASVKKELAKKIDPPDTSSSDEETPVIKLKDKMMAAEYDKVRNLAAKAKATKESAKHDSKAAAVKQQAPMAIAPRWPQDPTAPLLSVPPPSTAVAPVVPLQMVQEQERAAQLMFQRHAPQQRAQQQQLEMERQYQLQVMMQMHPSAAASMVHASVNNSIPVTANNTNNVQAPALPPQHTAEQPPQQQPEDFGAFQPIASEDEHQGDHTLKEEAVVTSNTKIGIVASAPPEEPTPTADATPSEAIGIEPTQNPVEEESPPTQEEEAPSGFLDWIARMGLKVLDVIVGADRMTAACQDYCNAKKKRPRSNSDVPDGVSSNKRARIASPEAQSPSTSI